MVGNGLANIYIHNWIRMDPLLDPSTRPRQHVSTMCRQLAFDLVFIVENITLMFIAVNSNVTEINENRVAFAVVLLGENNFNHLKFRFSEKKGHKNLKLTIFKSETVLTKVHSLSK